MLRARAQVRKRSARVTCEIEKNFSQFIIPQIQRCVKNFFKRALARRVRKRSVKAKQAARAEPSGNPTRCSIPRARSYVKRNLRRVLAQVFARFCLTPVTNYRIIVEIRGNLRFCEDFATTNRRFRVPPPDRFRSTFFRLASKSC